MSKCIEGQGGDTISIRVFVHSLSFALSRYVIAARIATPAAALLRFIFRPKLLYLFEVSALICVFTASFFSTSSFLQGAHL
jgi:hypothetical protein